jgi:hypothetical protein
VGYEGRNTPRRIRTAPAATVKSGETMSKPWLVLGRYCLIQNSSSRSGPLGNSKSRLSNSEKPFCIGLPRAP